MDQLFCNFMQPVAKWCKHCCTASFGDQFACHCTPVASGLFFARVQFGCFRAAAEERSLWGTAPALRWLQCLHISFFIEKGSLFGLHRKWGEHYLLTTYHMGHGRSGPFRTTRYYSHFLKDIVRTFGLTNWGVNKMQET